VCVIQSSRYREFLQGIQLDSFFRPLTEVQTLKISSIILIIGAGMIFGGFSINHLGGAIMMQDVRENFIEHGNFEEAMNIIHENDYLYALSSILYILENGGFLVFISGGIIFVIEIWKNKKHVEKT